MSKEGEDAKRQASEYERKAMLLLQRAQDGQLQMAEAERLADYDRGVPCWSRHDCDADRSSRQTNNCLFNYRWRNHGDKFSIVTGAASSPADQ
jgi:hypothetical protein